MKNILLFILSCFAAFNAISQSVPYPYPVKYLPLELEKQKLRMAFMDVKPEQSNGKTVLLFHGKNFNGYYWKDVISFLKQNGFRVIVPDQIGWGLSDKPGIHYSFHLLAANTKKLLDSLGITKVHLVGHSMGGMLAARFALQFPASVEKLVFENPIGLEDYRLFVPYRSVDEQYAVELKGSYESYKKYQQSYFPEWKPQYEPYVAAQYMAMKIPGFEKAAWVSALTYDMIYQQPLVYEFKNLEQETLIIIGQEDRTIVGKNLLTKEKAEKYGQYPALGKKLNQEIKNSQLVELKGVGHIPHIQVPEIFREKLLAFFQGKPAN